MAQSLEEQVGVVERALGECMIGTALVIVRSWLNEIGENNPYEEAFASIQKRYGELFTEWLNIDDPAAEEELDNLTGETYLMVDAVYADLRLKRGLSPDMHGFNHDSVQSVLNYFENCIRLRPEDLEWFHDIVSDDEHADLALVAATALGRNLRTCFSVDGMLALIDGMNAENEVVADQCISQMLELLILYDVRIDFFPNIQDAFVSAMATNDSSDHVFEVLCALVEATERKWLEMFATGMYNTSMLPPELQKMIETSGLEHDLKTLLQWLPDPTNNFLSELIPLIPDTWLYAVMIEDYPERERALTYVCVHAGYRDLLWDHPDVAEQVYLHTLRDGTDKPIDYINYAHCLLLKGDRMMAYESYKQARKLCKTSKEFFALFRPDRRQLVDHGIPLEHVYMLEDQLLESHT